MTFSMKNLDNLLCYSMEKASKGKLGEIDRKRQKI